MSGVWCASLSKTPLSAIKVTSTQQLQHDINGVVILKEALHANNVGMRQLGVNVQLLLQRMPAAVMATRVVNDSIVSLVHELCTKHQSHVNV